MSPIDVSGVFSRQFVVGHFLPAFFAFGLAALATSKDGLPDAYQSVPGLSAKLLALGVAALPAGLLLSGVHAHIHRMFAGQATERRIAEDLLEGTLRRKWSLRGLVDRWHRNRVRRHQQRRDAWKRRERTWETNVIAAETFEQWFPADRRCILPTRLGNALRAFQSHLDSRYGLDGRLVWPRLEFLLSDGERTSLAEARTDVAFFLNCAVAFSAVAVWLSVDLVCNRSDRVLWFVIGALLASCLLLGCVLGAVTATYRLGTLVRAAMDLHRLELYDRLGLRRPAGRTDEEELSCAVNLWLGKGTPPSDALRLNIERTDPE